MARIVVIGGGVCGLTSAMLLARDGHEVTVLGARRRRRRPRHADEAWQGWERRGVNQFRMIHLFAPRFRSLLEAELPDVIEEAEALGAIRYNPMRLVPDEMIGGLPRERRRVRHGVGAPSGDGDRAVARRPRAHPGSRSGAALRSRASSTTAKPPTASRTSSVCAPTRARRFAPTSSSTRPGAVPR